MRIFLPFESCVSSILHTNFHNSIRRDTITIAGTTKFNTSSLFELPSTVHNAESGSLFSGVTNADSNVATVSTIIHSNDASAPATMGDLVYLETGIMRHLTDLKEDILGLKELLLDAKGVKQEKLGSIDINDDLEERVASKEDLSYSKKILLDAVGVKQEKQGFIDIIDDIIEVSNGTNAAGENNLTGAIDALNVETTDSPGAIAVDDSTNANADPTVATVTGKKSYVLRLQFWKKRTATVQL